MYVFMKKWENSVCPSYLELRIDLNKLASDTSYERYRESDFISSAVFEENDEVLS